MRTLREFLCSGLIEQLKYNDSIATRFDDEPMLLYQIKEYNANAIYSPRIIERVGRNYLIVDEQDNSRYYIQLYNGSLYCLSCVTL